MLGAVTTAVLLLLLLAVGCSGSPHPYDPHSSSSFPFFEGWFIRISNSNESVAFGIGHLPGQDPASPSAACFLVASAPVQNGLVASPESHHSRPAKDCSGPDCTMNSAIESQQSLANPRPPYKWVQYFSSLKVHASKQQALCIDCPAFVAFGSTARGSCRLEVTGSLVTIQAELAGEFKFGASNDPSTATILPWGETPGSSPEGWLPGALLKLHWYVYSMATPIHYNLTLLSNSSKQRQQLQQQQVQKQPRWEQQRQKKIESQQQQRKLHVASESQVQRSFHEKLKQQLQRQNQVQHQEQQHADGQTADVITSFDNDPFVGSGDSLVVAERSGKGYAHMEKNWGEAFPEQWIWAQGISADSQASFVLAGGSLPIRSGLLSKAASAVAARTAVPNLLLVKQTQSQSVHSDNTGPSRDITSTGGSNSNSSQANISSSGSKASNITSLGQTLAFAFSFHSQDLNLTIDPFHPGVVTAFDSCGCCGTLAVTLTSWSHHVVIRVTADPGSFEDLPCPTADGFRADADESYTATAHIRVYEGGPLAGKQAEGRIIEQALTMIARERGKAAAEPLDTDRLSLGGAVFEGAALEFGGLQRCTHAGNMSSS